ncbi:hypothetical protein DH2020_009037 [Rehmannia glutinosa]|uniref:WRKY domain-containing protein n=1 Tax=Rehmannia glutinosa TaxID=99300 RepID=A0ABR0X8G2_REHGL
MGGPTWIRQWSKEVKVEKLGTGYLLVMVTCKKGGEMLVSILEAFEKMNLNVVQARVTCKHFFGMEAIVEANIDATILNEAIFKDSENSPENSRDISPSSTISKDTKIASTSSSKRSRGGIQKRVVSVPIKDVERFKLKGDHQISSPPSDSWAWRKYGQKPIKGSPYPRGYYKCSSSKGCPARKQVERSKLDPNTLVVTYSCEHNHPWIASRNHNHNHHRKAGGAATTNTTNSVSDDDELEEGKTINLISSSQSHHLISEDNYKFTNFGDGPLVNNIGGEFGWFSDFESTFQKEGPIYLTEDRITTDNEMAMIFTAMIDDDESLFSNLGELPECATVFRRGMVERRRHSLATSG